ncbi:inner membrane transporter RhtA [Nakamurella panacisegetis]|uniref:Inner membrane transporter RhtA n=1 Tax=Nakamurella panacisegetis TaxID=1090615 RepID=A0A1H0I7Y3_9ACTN|nr:EamA family transporter [Nakamurella panacisegetis]SDO27485.1 inner membrane transporter RhtA [Nakamurella panacisegetis]
MELTAAGPTSKAKAGAIGLFLGGAFSVQFGAGVAVLLFPKAGPLGTVTLRLVVSAVLMLAVCRPSLRERNRGDWLTVLGFGAALAGMNGLFYQAIDRIPLGAAVTLEVLGPLALSVITNRRLISWLWAGLALAGVVLLSDGLTGLNLPGVLFALGTGVFWAAYVLLSGRTGARFSGADGLALSLGVAAVLILPFGLLTAGSVLLHPDVFGPGAAVAVLSSMIPYTLELFALRTLSASTFSVLLALAPAVAAVSGFLILGQALTVRDLVAMALVIVAGAGAVLTAPARVNAVPSAGAGELLT